MQTAISRLIVLESRGTWSAALRRVIVADRITWREVRSVAECEHELAAAPASFVVAEVLAASASALMDRIAAWNRRYPACVVAVVAARDLREWRGIFRESGAVHVVFSPRELEPLGRAIERHIERVPQPPGSIAERIWAELPLSTHK